MMFFTLPHNGNPLFARLTLQGAGKGQPYRCFVSGKTHLSLYAQVTPGVAWSEVYRHVLKARGCDIEHAAVMAHHPDEKEGAQWHVTIIHKGEVIQHWSQATNDVSGSIDVQGQSHHYWVGLDETTSLPNTPFNAKASIEHMAPLTEQEQSVIGQYTLKKRRWPLMVAGAGLLVALAWGGAAWLTAPEVTPVKAPPTVETVEVVETQVKTDPNEAYREAIAKGHSAHRLMYELGMAMTLTDTLPQGWKVNSIQSQSGNVQIDIQRETHGEVGMMLAFADYYKKLKPYITLWSDRADIRWKNPSDNTHWLSHGAPHSSTKVALLDALTRVGLVTKVVSESANPHFISSMIEVKGELSAGRLGQFSQAFEALPLFVRKATFSPKSERTWEATLTMILITRQGDEQ
ncbi:hypothetical protein AB4428_06465 [Vibrio lentus]